MEQWCYKRKVIKMTTLEIIKVREKTDSKIVFASTEDLTKFFDQILNGQGVIFEYVDKNDYQCAEYINPQIVTLINDGKISITSRGKK
jgi:hypothetical protein